MKIVSYLWIILFYGCVIEKMPNRKINDGYSVLTVDDRKHVSKFDTANFDVKIAGEVKNFTGIDSPYQRPENPDLTIPTHQMSVDESLTLLLNLIEPKIRY